MDFFLDAACMCSKGKGREKNSDNFFFDGRCLEEDNKGLRHPVTMSEILRHELCLAVFDGKGSCNHGEKASFTAADCVQSFMKELRYHFIPERVFLTDMCRKINSAVSLKQKELSVGPLRTTVAACLFSYNYIYVCNLGNSGVYRIRAGEFMRLSEKTDEMDDLPERKNRMAKNHHIINERYRVEPHIAKGELRRGDQYLICSDGLTDMLCNLEIDSIMSSAYSSEECVKKLIEAAFFKGGEDDVTVIVGRII